MEGGQVELKGEGRLEGAELLEDVGRAERAKDDDMRIEFAGPIATTEVIIILPRLFVLIWFEV